NIERFRKALVLLGEPDPDALIASRLSGESPFTSTDLSLEGGEFGFEPPPPPPEPDIDALLAEAAAADDPRLQEWQPKRRKEEQHHFQLSENAIDLESILGDLEKASTAHAAAED